ncbi:MAG: T9SS type A sorting domain-containing protein [Chitinophagales bacterium]
MRHHAQKALLAMLILLVSTVFQTQAQLYTFNENTTGTPSFVDPNLYAMDLKRKNGLRNATGYCPTGFSSRNFSTDFSFSTAKGAVQLRIGPQPDVTMTVTSLSAKLRISENGPIYVRAAYSLNKGLTWVTADVDFTPAVGYCGYEGTEGYWDIPDFTTDNTILFRLYGFQAGDTIGRLEVKNLEINGSLTLIDNDGDGYGIYIDCDDTNPDVHPGAIEYCNSIDEDCDGDFGEVDAIISPSGEITICKHETVTLSVPDEFETYQWYKNDEPISIGTTNTLTTDKPGYYQVYLESGLCTGMTAVQAVAVAELPFANIFWPEGLDLCLDDSLKLKASYDVGYTWQWYRYGTALEFETFYKMLATEPGDYYCVVTNAFGCTRTTDAVTVYNSCRTSSTEISGLEIYPNPANDKFYVSMQLGSETSNAVIQMLDITGEVVYSEVSEVVNGSLYEVLDVSSLPAGVYMVQVVANEANYNSKLIISK